MFDYFLSEWNSLEPLRIAAMPKTVLDALIDFQPIQLKVAPVTLPPSILNQSSARFPCLHHHRNPNHHTFI